jgi:hypothetical protein
MKQIERIATGGHDHNSSPWSLEARLHTMYGCQHNLLHTLYQFLRHPLVTTSTIPGYAVHQVIALVVLCIWPLRGFDFQGKLMIQLFVVISWYKRIGKYLLPCMI